jgi:single-strand DNA-binding protein
MEKFVNKVELSGHAGMDPEVRSINDNLKIAKFSLATNESYKNKEGEWVRDTTWHNIVLWNKLATEAEEKVKKGNRVNLTGKLSYRQYIDKNGMKHSFAEIQALSFDVVESKIENLVEAGDELP